MKQLINILLGLMCIVWVASCDSSDALPNGYVEPTADGASTVIMEGYISPSHGFTALNADNFPVEVYIDGQHLVGKDVWFSPVVANRLDAMTAVPEGNWVEKAKINVGVAYWARYTTLAAYSYLKFRVVDIISNSVVVEYLPGERVERPNVNANSSAVAYATNWEMPRLNESNYFAAHTATYNGTELMNLAVEWNDASRHSAWVAFTFDENTPNKNVGRNEEYMWDPKMPKTLESVENWNHTSDGFDKGHLCASGDRQYSVTANKQTFYYTNISPMLADLNQGYWGKLEGKVRNWSNSIPTKYDKLYIAKGGTADNLLKGFSGTPVYNPPQTPETDENGFTKKGMGVPKYYFMAILAQKGETFRAIGFWVEHKEGHVKEPSAAELQASAVSIDQLEQNTGLDFFCSMPDDIENAVESNLNTSDWAW